MCRVCHGGAWASLGFLVCATLRVPDMMKTENSKYCIVLWFRLYSKISVSPKSQNSEFKCPRMSQYIRKAHKSSAQPASGGTAITLWFHVYIEIKLPLLTLHSKDTTSDGKPEMQQDITPDGSIQPFSTRGCPRTICATRATL
jgi:hypothetical protein